MNQEQIGLGYEFEIYDEKGRIIPLQIIEDGKVVFIAEDVPPVG